LTGTRLEAPVDTTTRMDTVVQQFQISHGVNYLMLDGLVRYPFRQDSERLPKGRVHVYGGLGLGPVIAHPENHPSPALLSSARGRQCIMACAASPAAVTGA
jgi:hypothetical protein